MSNTMPGTPPPAAFFLIHCLVYHYDDSLNFEEVFAKSVPERQITELEFTLRPVDSQKKSPRYFSSTMLPLPKSL